MPRYNISTSKTWNQTLDDLGETFRKWDISDWRTDPQRPPASRRKYYEHVAERRVALTWTKNGRSISIAHDQQATPQDNLRVLYLAAEAMRLNEARGIGDVLASAYAQLPACCPELVEGPADDDPWRALYLHPDAGRDAAESMYRTLAKISHPEGTRPDADQWKAIQTAIEAIREENV